MYCMWHILQAKITMFVLEVFYGTVKVSKNYHLNELLHDILETIWCHQQNLICMLVFFYGTVNVSKNYHLKELLHANVWCHHQNLICMWLYFYSWGLEVQLEFYASVWLYDSCWLYIYGGICHWYSDSCLCDPFWRWWEPYCIS
jgi:hypothetical protein